MSLPHLERGSLSKFSNTHSALRFSPFIPPSNSIYWQVFIVKNKIIGEKNKNKLNITSESVLNSQKEILNFDRKKNHSDLKALNVILLLMGQMSLAYSYVIEEWKFPFPERDFTCFSLLELAQTLRCKQQKTASSLFK